MSNLKKLLEIHGRLKGAETLEAYINRVSPNLPPPPHIKEHLIPLFERTRYEEVRACISLPPGFAKSVTACHAIAWRTLVDPSCKNSYSSYSADLAIEHSREIRRMAVESGVTLRHDSKAVAAWKTEQGGALYASGVGGPLTGKRVSGVAVTDDLLKNMEEANSQIVRDKGWDWVNSVLMTRLIPGASVIHIATRWHMDDIIGRLIAMGGWEVVNLPAVMNSKGEAVDEREHPPEDTFSLWPEMYPLEHLARVRRQVGEYIWWALYQGVPRPKGMAVFDPIPSRFELENFQWEGQRGFIAVDPAATASTKADHSVALMGAMGGYGDDSELWILDQIKGQWTIPELVRRLVEFQKKWKCPIGVEAVGGFKSIPDMLREAEPRLILVPIELRGDKFARAQPYAAAWNQQRIYVPTDAPWADSFISEHASFTGIGDVHDDQVDAAAHLFTALQRSRRRVRGSYQAGFLPLG